jgi:hypothetical protein
VTFSKQNIGYFICLGMYIDVQTTYNQASNLTYAHLLSVPLTTLRLFFAVQIICFNFSFNLATRHSYWKCTFYYYFADLSRTCMQINKKWVETEICGKRSWWNLSAQTNGKRSWWINFVAAEKVLIQLISWQLCLCWHLVKWSLNHDYTAKGIQDWNASSVWFLCVVQRELVCWLIVESFFIVYTFHATFASHFTGHLWLHMQLAT